MKTAAAALLLALIATVPALAGPCDGDLGAIDAALSAARLPPDETAQIKDMRTQAARLCEAGNLEEAADVIAEAKSLLGME